MLLTHYSPDAGCSCKVDPNDLRQILAALRAGQTHTAPDDAAVRSLGDGRVLTMSIDFAPPVSDDPRLAGEILAKHAMSDIFAMGMQPNFMDVLLVVPRTADQVMIGAEIMAGIAAAAADVYCEIVGGHTIEGLQPMIGAAVRSVGDEQRLKLKSAARPGDLVAITKPIGVGALLIGLREGLLTPARAEAALSVMRRTNVEGAAFGLQEAVHAMTDVTGFGLGGHCLEVAEASGVTIRLDWAAIPKLDGALRAIREGYAPSLAARILTHARQAIESDLGEAELLLLMDPQTNGGLLVTFEPEARDVLTATAQACGAQFTVIGRVEATDLSRHPLVISRES